MSRKHSIRLRLPHNTMHFGPMRITNMKPSADSMPEQNKATDTNSKQTRMGARQLTQTVQLALEKANCS